MPLRFLLLVALSIFQHSAAQTKIASIGDSITEGGNLELPMIDSYPARLQALLGTNEFLVRNFGVSGRAMLKSSNYSYWREAAFTNSQSFDPDIVIIQLGTNDSNPINWDQHGTNFVSDYRDMVAMYAALASAPRIYLCTPCPVFGSVKTSVNAGTIRTNIAPAIRALAAELSLPLIDMNTRMTNAAWFPDTVHPNTQGMAAMGAIVFEALFGGPTVRPELRVERIGPARIVLSWPTNAAGLVALTAPTLNGEKWVVGRAVPYKVGEMIRQTNDINGTSRSYFQLAGP